jgi:DNA-binding transcriptional LysR family regulator
MTVRHMRIFKTVCENGYSITKAAEKLNMTQPAVSLAISELENYYGVKLFDRISRRLYISEAGKLFLEYSNTITLTFDDMEKRIRSWEKSGIIRVGASISIGAMLMPKFVKKFNLTYPDTKVNVIINRSEELESLIIENKLDFALVEGIIHDANLIYEDFMEDRLALVVSDDFEENVIKTDEIYNFSFLLREKGSGTREVFESTLTSKSYPLPKPTWESMSTAALINAAEAGLGIAVVPYRMAAERINSGSIKEVFIDNIEFKRKYKLIYHKDKKLSEMDKSFIGMCRDAGTED